MATAVTMARRRACDGSRSLGRGTPGSPRAAYGAPAPGSRSVCSCPSDTPEPFRLEAAAHGAEVHLVHGGTSRRCGRMTARARATRADWFDLSDAAASRTGSRARRPWATRSPSSSTGTLPDVIVYPTGGGTGLIGMWKAFEEMEQLGLDRRGTAAAHGRRSGRPAARRSSRRWSADAATADALAASAHVRVGSVRAVSSGRCADPPGAPGVRRDRGRGHG